MKKSYKNIVFLLLAFSLCSFVVQAQKGDAAKLTAEIQKLNDKMIKAMEEENHDFLASMYVDDVYHMPSYEKMIHGKDKMIERERKNHEAGFKMLSMKFDVVEVIPAGDYAIEIGKYNVSMEIPGMDNPMDDHGKYVTVWERQKDGSLKIKVETWNTDVNPMEMGDAMHGHDKKHEEHKKP
ncbi:MAG: nuclear transport factor 2 family protein [Bacteroidales bacterium]|nr:nuclear transport factor 2 family protein [Bacteroidales bacterium]